MHVPQTKSLWMSCGTWSQISFPPALYTAWERAVWSRNRSLGQIILPYSERNFRLERSSVLFHVLTVTITITWYSYKRSVKKKKHLYLGWWWSPGACRGFRRSFISNWMKPWVLNFLHWLNGVAPSHGGDLLLDRRKRTAADRSGTLWPCMEYLVDVNFTPDHRIAFGFYRSLWRQVFVCKKHV